MTEPVSASVLEWWFVDVRVARIQGYLGRTPDLKGRRAASAWISDATDRDGLAAWVAQDPVCAAAGVEVNDQAGQADGLIPLIMPLSGDPDAVARAALERLRDRLPGAWLQASWAQAGTYLAAAKAAKSMPEQSIMQAPVLGDFPALSTCQLCRIDPMVAVIDLHEKPQVEVCVDCHRRYNSRYRQPGLRSGAVPVTAEYELLSRLELTAGHVVDDFTDLARLGAVQGNRNHLATVFIDGNAVGDLFDGISQGEDPGLKQRASQQLSQATRAALTVAARQVLGRRDGRPVMTVIPHVAGGDDVLVSLVADQAWAFVTTYLHQFQQATQVLAPEGVTASAGVVFAHAKFPFRRAVELSEQLLRRAKIGGAGRAATVCWLDVTTSGEPDPSTRPVWRCDDLIRQEQDLRALAGLPAAGRETLRRLIDPLRPLVSAARIVQQARRLNMAPVITPFLDVEQSPQRLSEALDLVRWWR